MIIGIGTDIIEISRVKKACDSKAFLLRYYTDAEIGLIGGNMARAAKNFAAKEAVSKCLGTGFSGFSPRDVEVLRDEKGRPFVNLYGEALRLSSSLGIKKIHVSLSDTDSIAVAFAVAES